MLEEKEKSWFRKHWIITIILGLFILGAISNNESSSNNHSSDINKLPKFDPELIRFGDSLTMYKIINRNDYLWHNVEITVNDHYSCWSRDVLEPEDSITIDAVTCNQFVVNYNIVESVDIKSDEGAERYSLK